MTMPSDLVTSPKEISKPTEAPSQEAILSLLRDLHAAENARLRAARDRADLATSRHQKTFDFIASAIRPFTYDDGPIRKGRLEPKTVPLATEYPVKGCEFTLSAKGARTIKIESADEVTIGVGDFASIDVSGDVPRLVQDGFEFELARPNDFWRALSTWLKPDR